MVTSALTARRTTAVAGQLIQKLLSLRRPPLVTAPFRSFSSALYSVPFETPQTSDEEEDEDEQVTRISLDGWGNYRPEGGGGRGPHEMWRDGVGLHVRMDMPGLDMEHVSLSIHHRNVIIRGKGPEKAGNFDRSDVSVGMRYLMSLSPLFKLSEIQMKMKNGVLNVLVPAAEVGDASVFMQAREYDD